MSDGSCILALRFFIEALRLGFGACFPTGSIPLSSWYCRIGVRGRHLDGYKKAHNKGRRGLRDILS